MIEVREPATGALLHTLPAATEDDVRAAAAAARDPQPYWAAVPAAGRARYLRRAAQLILDDLDPLAELLAREAGIPRTEAVLAELLPSVGGLHALAEDGPRALQDRRAGRVGIRRALVVHAPAGVVGIAAAPASPWAEVVLEVGAALLAGNGVLVAPAAALAAERAKALLERAGIPPGLVQVVHGAAAARALSNACDAVAAPEPPSPQGTMLVLAGAPLARVAGGALWAAFAGAGQSPAAVGRLVALPDRAHALLDALQAGAQGLRVGDPLDPRTDVGPLRDAASAARTAELVEDAVARGARLACGGPVDVPGLAGAFFAPAILRGVPPDARVLHEPVPGPVLAVVEAGGERDAVALARQARGAVSVWCGERAHGERIARTLPAPLTWVNEHGFSAPAAPVRVARHAEVRQIASRPAELRSARRLPVDPDFARASIARSRLLHGREADRAAALGAGALPVARVLLGYAARALETSRSRSGSTGTSTRLTYSAPPWSATERTGSQDSP